MLQNNIDILIKNTSLLKQMLTIFWAFTESIFFFFLLLRVWTLQELSKCDTDMKWPNSNGNMEPKHLLEARLADKLLIC